MNKVININLSENYQLTEEEKKESLILWKKLIKNSYKKENKRKTGLPEHLIYNLLRDKNIFSGVSNINRSNGNIYGQFSMSYGQSWAYLATHSENKEYYQKLSKIVGYKYEYILKAICSKIY